MRSRRSVRHCKGTCLRLRDPLFVRVCGAPRVARVSVPGPADRAAFTPAFVRRSPVRTLYSTGFVRVATARHGRTAATASFIPVQVGRRVGSAGVVRAGAAGAGALARVGCGVIPAPL